MEEILHWNDVRGEPLPMRAQQRTYSVRLRKCRHHTLNLYSKHMMDHKPRCVNMPTDEQGFIKTGWHQRKSHNIGLKVHAACIQLFYLSWNRSWQWCVGWGLMVGKWFSSLKVCCIWILLFFLISRLLTMFRFTSAWIPQQLTGW